MIRTPLNAWSLAVGQVAALWSSTLTRVRLRLYGVQVGAKLRVRGWIDLHIHQTAVVSIGADCRFKSGFSENAVGGFRRMGIWVSKGGKLTIGRGVGISSSTIVCANSVTIGDEVYIGGDCAIYDTDFHSIPVNERLTRPDKTVKTAPVTIGRRSFIGGHSIILKGVTIGEEAVIGAESVVAKSVPPGEIWAGNPARYIGLVADAPSAATEKTPS